VPDQIIYLRMEQDKIRWFDPQSGMPLAGAAQPVAVSA
jgi:hypothetical protein